MSVEGKFYCLDCPVAANIATEIIDGLNDAEREIHAVFPGLVKLRVEEICKRRGTHGNPACPEPKVEVPPIAPIRSQR